MLRGLKIESVSLSNSACLAELVGYVTESKCQREWLDLIELEWGHVFSMARQIVKDQQEENENGAA